MSATRAALRTSKRSLRGDVAGTEQGWAGTTVYPAALFFFFFFPTLPFRASSWRGKLKPAALFERTWLRNVGTGSFPRTDSRVLATGLASDRQPAERHLLLALLRFSHEAAELCRAVQSCRFQRCPQPVQQTTNWPMKLTARPYQRKLRQCPAGPRHCGYCRSVPRQRDNKKLADTQGGDTPGCAATPLRSTTDEVLLVEAERVEGPKVWSGGSAAL